MPYFNNHQYASGNKVSLFVYLSACFVGLITSIHTHTDTPGQCSAGARFML
jgi:hypothetical protein